MCFKMKDDKGEAVPEPGPGELHASLYVTGVYCRPADLWLNGQPCFCKRTGISCHVNQQFTDFCFVKCAQVYLPF